MNEFKVGDTRTPDDAAVVYTSLQVTSNQSGFGEYQKLRTIISDASGIFPKPQLRSQVSMLVVSKKLNSMETTPLSPLKF